MYTEEKESNLRPISELATLFGNNIPVGKNGKPLSERAHLVRYFVERAQDRKGLMAAGRVGYMLSHINTSDLYGFKSILESEVARPWPEEAGPKPQTHERWNRIFWARLRG